MDIPGEIAEYNGGSQFRWAHETEERNRLWKARHDIYWTTLQSNPGCRAIITDVCVPITSLPELVDQTKADISLSGVKGSNLLSFLIIPLSMFIFSILLNIILSFHSPYFRTCW